MQPRAPIPLEYLANFPTETQSSSARREFSSRLDREPIRALLAQYSKRGGSLDALLWLMYGLLPRARLKLPPYHRFESLLTRCADSLNRLLKLTDLPAPLSVAARSLKGEIEDCLTLRRNYERGTKFLKRGKGAGRPKGIPQANKILALIEKEFRRCFGRPRYADILLLAQTIAPEQFPPTITTDHIRQRILTVPPALIEEFHNLMLGCPRP